MKYIMAALAILLMAWLLWGLMAPAPAQAIVGDNTTGAWVFLKNWGHSPRPLVEFNSHGIGIYHVKKLGL